MAKLKITPKAKPAASKPAPAAPHRKEARDEDREAWLIKACDLLAPLFRAGGLDELPKVRVSVGWPGRGRKALGICWDKAASEDGSFQIFISPTVHNSVDALGVLTHELCHAATECTGHSRPFIALARSVGLEGKATATFPGERLVLTFEELIHKELGTYPHAKLNPDPEATGEKKQTTRMVKCVCEESGYSVRTTREWLRKFGAPLSPANKKPMKFDESVLEENEGEEGEE